MPRLWLFPHIIRELSPYLTRLWSLNCVSWHWELFDIHLTGSLGLPSDCLCLHNSGIVEDLREFVYRFGVPSRMTLFLYIHFPSTSATSRPALQPLSIRESTFQWTLSHIIYSDKIENVFSEKKNKHEPHLRCYHHFISDLGHSAVLFKYVQHLPPKI